MEDKLFKGIIDDVSHNPSSLQNYPDSIRKDIFLMREISKIKGIDSIILYYVLDEVQDDLEFHLNLLQNGIFHSIDFIPSSFGSYSDEYSFDISHFSNSFIGLSVRESELFWELLNKKLEEAGCATYDIEKEVRIAREELERMNYSK